MTPTAIGFAIFACLALINRRLGGSVLYPPAQFSLLWAALLGISLFTTDGIFPLSGNAVVIFAIGGLAFSVGGAMRLVADQPRPTCGVPPDAHRVSRAVATLLTAGLAGLVVLFPVFWNYVLSLANPGFSNLWLAIRSGAIAAAEAPGQRAWLAVFLDNATLVAILLALTAMAYYGERGTSRLVAVGLVLVATAYSLVTGSRSGGSIVLLGSFGIRLMKRRRFSWRLTAAGVAAVLLMYVPVTLLRTVKGGDPLATSMDDARLTGDTAILYSVGSLSAFDVYLASPSTMPDTWSIRYAVLRAANRLGFNVVAPSIHMSYVTVGPKGPVNTYTMYFAYYPEFGMAGVILFSALVGYALVWLHSVAAVRQGCFLVLYGLSFNELCKSGFSEGFFMSLNMWLKAAAYCVVLYLLQRASSRRDDRQRVPEAAICCE